MPIAGRSIRITGLFPLILSASDSFVIWCAESGMAALPAQRPGDANALRRHAEELLRLAKNTSMPEVAVELEQRAALFLKRAAEEEAAKTP
jgi:hypothetical protein